MTKIAVNSIGIPNIIATTSKNNKTINRVANILPVTEVVPADKIVAIIPVSLINIFYCLPQMKAISTRKVVIYQNVPTPIIKLFGRFKHFKTL